MLLWRLIGSDMLVGCRKTSLALPFGTLLREVVIRTPSSKMEATVKQ